MTIRTYTGILPGVGELLVTAYDERTVEIAMREHPAATWGIPYPLTAEPLHPSQVGNEPVSALNDYLNGVS